MNERVRAAIIFSLKGVHLRPRSDLIIGIKSSQSVEIGEVRRTIDLMVDAGELEKIGPYGDLLRLRLQGVQATAPFWTRAMQYIAAHWIAIVALVISVIALFR